MPTIEARLAWHPRRALDLLRQQRRLRRAAKAIPKPVPWAWARPRLLPLLAGPYLGPDRLVTSVSTLGCAVIYGIEVGGALIILDDHVMQRWECTVTQVAEAAGHNLEQRAGRLSPANVRRGVLAGHVVRVLDDVPWASSLVLVPDHLIRVFGVEDQMFAAPRRDMLLSLSPDTPGWLAAEIIADFEADAAAPLLLDPFGLIAGRLFWQGADAESTSD